MCSCRLRSLWCPIWSCECRSCFSKLRRSLTSTRAPLPPSPPLPAKTRPPSRLLMLPQPPSRHRELPRPPIQLLAHQLHLLSLLPPSPRQRQQAPLSAERLPHPRRQSQCLLLHHHLPARGHPRQQHRVRSQPPSQQPVMPLLLPSRRAPQALLPLLHKQPSLPLPRALRPQLQRHQPSRQPPRAAALARQAAAAATGGCCTLPSPSTCGC